MSLSAFWMVIAVGLVNWMATELLVNSVIFQEPRRAIRHLGKKIQGNGSNPLRRILGEKLGYFVSCCLCVGVWIGFIQAAVFSGPLQPAGFWSWSSWIANGLLYKAIGHIFLQFNGLLHECNSLLHERVRQEKSKNEHPNRAQAVEQEPRSSTQSAGSNNNDKHLALSSQ